ncbi:MAG: hypothetical protein QNJ97_01100 [Myxococcota bacterium]|nr:hypothetical protein [Myxococcota bacterium]
MNLKNLYIFIFIAVLLLNACKSSKPEQNSTMNSHLSALPQNPDPARYYLFYLHGKIVEGSDGMPVSQEYGTYEYRKIVQELSEQGFVTISEIREKDTDIEKYSQKVIEWIEFLLAKQVPAKQITVVGASKGGMIAAKVSSNLKNRDVKFVFLAGLFEMQYRKQQIELYGDILSIYDESDKMPSSPELFFSSKGIGKSKSIVTQMGLGHGLLYKPYRVWMDEVIKWSGI